MRINNISQRGAVSLFIVVFAALLITVVSVGFVGIMVKDQQQATATDLSQSAYDSAQAGVEDAKRALIRYQSICNSGTVTDCNAAKTSISSTKCNEAVSALTDVAAAIVNNEVKIQTGGNNNLDQAYTCVKVILDTDDYLGALATDDSVVIPLVSTDSFDTVQVQWFNSDNLAPNRPNSNISLLSPASGVPLLTQNSWPANRPPVMRAQLIQFGSGFTLDDFNSKNAANESNANTLFLYPTGSVNPNVDTKLFINDIRRTPTGSPVSTTCSGDLTTGGYSCATKLTLPAPIGGGNRTAFLRLNALYNKANFRITLLKNNGTTPVLFNAVQPIIDSTGRANDLFRRVQARVELFDANFQYPVAAVDTSGNFCKEFTITDIEIDYKPGNCEP